VLGVARAAREQGIPGEQMRLAGQLTARVVDERDAARGVAAQVDDGELAVPDADLVVFAPVACCTSGSACQWSQCWWVVTIRASGMSPTRASSVPASFAASMSSSSPVLAHRSR